MRIISQIMTISLPLVGFLAVLPSVSSAQNRPVQREHRAGFEPADPAVYTVLTEFHAYDRSLPMAARVVGEHQDDHGLYQKIVFTTQSRERVPGTLALPGGGGAEHPAVLLLHGLGNRRERWWEPDRVGLPEALLDAGFAVFAIDLALHGERSAQNDFESPVYLTFGDSLYVRNRDMIIQSTIDARRALDYLRARDDVDPERLAVAGYSMGGMIALYLAALESDLRAVVASAVPTTAQPAPIDPFHFAPHAKAPVLLQIGREDWLSSQEDIDRLVGLLPADSTELAWFDSGHGLPSSFAANAAAWLQSQLTR